MTTTLTQESLAAHPFEQAGLGVAPFAYIGSERRVGPIRVYDKNGQPTGEEWGAPGQPMGTCEYCGTGIAECCFIRDANGKTFIVGNECVRRTGDAKIVKAARKAHNAAAAERKREREWTRFQAIREMVNNDERVRAVLASQPHPRFDGKTRLDWAEWMLKNAGMAGRMDVCKYVEAL